MPRVRFLQGVGGANVSYSPGEVVDLPAGEAARWADGVRADLVRAEPAETPEDAREARSPQVETATAEAETAEAEPDTSGSDADSVETTEDTKPKRSRSRTSK